MIRSAVLRRLEVRGAPAPAWATAAWSDHANHSRREDRDLTTSAATPMTISARIASGTHASSAVAGRTSSVDAVTPGLIRRWHRAGYARSQSYPEEHRLDGTPTPSQRRSERPVCAGRALSSGAIHAGCRLDGHPHLNSTHRRTQEAVRSSRPSRENGPLATLATDPLTRPFSPTLLCANTSPRGLGQDADPDGTSVGSCRRVPASCLTAPPCLSVPSPECDRPRTAHPREP
jgi:hypothetical protein